MAVETTLVILTHSVWEVSGLDIGRARFQSPRVPAPGVIHLNLSCAVEDPAACQAQLEINQHRSCRAA